MGKAPRIHNMSKQEKDQRLRGQIPAVELLEERRLMSVTLDGNVLRIKGTEDEDFIRVIDIPNKKNRILVQVNEQQKTFKRSSVRLIRINGEGGEDFVSTKFMAKRVA